MTGTLGLLETTGLTPAMVAIDAMTKMAEVRVVQLELNDLYGVCVKISGMTADVQRAIEEGRRVAEQMQGAPIATVLTRVSASAVPALQSPSEFNPLIEQNVVFQVNEAHGGPATTATTNQPDSLLMNQPTPMALGFIETQGFTAVFEAIDTACKAASVEVLAKEKLGGGYVTVIIQGQLSAVSTAVAAGKEKVNGLGKLIAAHVIARPSEAVLKLLPKIP
jgi:carbon dioxide concentrating mechanism protein CcmO